MFRFANVVVAAAVFTAPVWAAGPVFETIFPARTGMLDGRLLLVLSTDAATEPRMQIDNTPKSQIVFGVDVDGLAAGQRVTVDEHAFGYPVRTLTQLPAGEYSAQAVFNVYETFRRADGKTIKLPMDRGEGQRWNLAPGNLYSTPQKVRIGAVRKFAISLDRVIPPIDAPKDTKYIRHVRIQSQLLSQFWGRPIYLGANILVPQGFDDHPEAHYPIAINHGHFPADFDGFRTMPPDPDLKPDYSDRFHLAGYNRIQQQEAYKLYQQWTAQGFPRFLVVELQHANPYYDDSYAVNSANLGPYGDAIETELVPYIEKHFRAIGQGVGAVLVWRFHRGLGSAGSASILSGSL